LHRNFVTPLDRFRPRWHFTTHKNWINDPNGLIWAGGRWHLYYQYNPHGSQWGNMSWGHASSVDLVTWEEHPLAIAQDDTHWIFSGSAVLDAANSSGLGSVDNPPLVALYTGAGKTPGCHQVQCIAYSLDQGNSWTKYAGNPVLDEGMTDFRDPKIMWHGPAQHWVMVVCKSTQNQIAIYTSPNLIDWTHTSDFGPAGAAGHLWECPDLIELPVDAAPGKTRWILKVDYCHSDDGRGCSGMVFFGQFDGVHFTPDCDANGVPRWQRLDEGGDFYAAMSWHGAPAGDTRRIWIGWMNNHIYSSETPTGDWRGMMSVPRVLGVCQMQGDLWLTQNPVTEYGDVLGPATIWNAEPLQLEGGCARMEGVLDASGIGRSGFAVCWGDNAELRFELDRDTGMVCLDRSQSGAMSDHPVFVRPATAQRIARSAEMPFALILDKCSVEIFIDNGVQVFSAQIFPPEGNPVLRLITA
jgi:fructan beta-fructosidase